jgi:hypothetical protein
MKPKVVRSVDESLITELAHEATREIQFALLTGTYLNEGYIPRFCVRANLDTATPDIFVEEEKATEPSKHT